RLKGARTGRVLVFGDAEENERLDAEFARGADFIDERIDAQLEVAGHRADLGSHAFAGPHEQRQDQVAWRQFGFAHELADERVVAEPAGGGGWGGGGGGGGGGCVGGSCG